MTRALWVTAVPPDRGGAGGNLRQAYLLEALTRRMDTHAVVAGDVTDPLVRASVASLDEVDVLPSPPPKGTLSRRFRDIWWATVEPFPREVAAHRRVRAALRPHLRQHDHFDVVLVEYAALAPLIPPSRDNVWILTLHNVLSEMAAQARRLAPTRRHQWVLDRERAKAARFESWVTSAFDHVVVPSPHDRRWLPSGCVAVVPNGADTSHLRPSPVPREPRLVMTAALDTEPNIDAAVWFCRDVLPLVKNAVPNVSLELVGRRPTPQVRNLADGITVHVHADVDDIRPYLARARVAVVPLRIGTGTRLKALEAMAARRPIVGTTIGLSGLDIVPGRDAVIADDSAEMAAAVIRLLRDDVEAERISEFGRQLVASRYDWRVIGDEFAELVADAATRGGWVSR